MKVTGTSEGFIFFQALLAAAAWGFLAWTVARQLAPGWKRVLAGWAVLAFATSLPVTMWNRVVLSESITISLVVVVFALLTWTVRNPTVPRILATTLVAALLALARDEEIYGVVLLAVVAVVLYGFAEGRRPARFSTRMGILSLCLAVAVAPAFALQFDSHRSTQNVTNDLEVRIFPFPRRVAWFAQHGMPDAPQIDALTQGAKSGSGDLIIVVAPPRTAEFSALYEWIATRGMRSYIGWLVDHPGELLFLPLDRPQEAFNFGGGNLGIYAPSNPAMPAPLTGVAWPGARWLFVLAGVDLVLAWASGVIRRRSFWTSCGFATLGVIAMLIAWQGDGQEVTRHTIEGLVQVRAGLWVAFLVGFFALPWGKVGPVARQFARWRRVPVTALTSVAQSRIDSIPKHRLLDSPAAYAGTGIHAAWTAPTVHLDNRPSAEGVSA